MSTISPFAANVPTYQTGLGPTSSPGGFSNQSFGAPGLLSFGYPVPGVDPFFSNSAAAVSGNLNRLLGYANGSAVNINYGPIPSTLGFGGLLLGSSFYGGSGVPGSSSPLDGSLGSFGGGANPGGSLSSDALLAQAGQGGAGIDPSAYGQAGYGQSAIGQTGYGQSGTGFMDPSVMAQLNSPANLGVLGGGYGALGLGAGGYGGLASAGLGGGGFGTGALGLDPTGALQAQFGGGGLGALGQGGLGALSGGGLGFDAGLGLQGQQQQQQPSLAQQLVPILLIAALLKKARGKAAAESAE